MSRKRARRYASPTWNRLVALGLVDTLYCSSRIRESNCGFHQFGLARSKSRGSQWAARFRGVDPLTRALSSEGAGSFSLTWSCFLGFGVGWSGGWDFVGLPVGLLLEPWALEGLGLWVRGSVIPAGWWFRTSSGLPLAERKGGY